MCVVSMVTDHYMQQWPTPSHMSPSIYRDIEELIRKAKDYDRIHNQPECPAPDKQKWLEDFWASKLPPINLTNMPSVFGLGPDYRNTVTVKTPSAGIWDKGTAFESTDWAAHSNYVGMAVDNP